MKVICIFFFFFQAEDGIRDYKVTGVQTCALPICGRCGKLVCGAHSARHACRYRDRKSTRLNSSHLVISYAVFCLKKKKKPRTHNILNNTNKPSYKDKQISTKT